MDRPSAFSTATAGGSSLSSSCGTVEGSSRLVGRFAAGFCGRSRPAWPDGCGRNCLTVPAGPVGLGREAGFGRVADVWQHVRAVPGANPERIPPIAPSASRHGARAHDEPATAPRGQRSDQVIPQPGRAQGSRHRGARARDRRRDRPERLRQEHLLQSGQRLPARRPRRGSFSTAGRSSACGRRRSCGSASPALSRARASSRSSRCAKTCAPPRSCATASTLLDALLGTPRSRRVEAAVEAIADELLDLVGLAGRGRRRAGDLPYGDQRRLELVRALATRPRLLMLDEPAAGMDAHGDAQPAAADRRRSAAAIGSPSSWSSTTWT